MNDIKSIKGYISLRSVLLASKEIAIKCLTERLTTDQVNTLWKEKQSTGCMDRMKQNLDIVLDTKLKTKDTMLFVFILYV